MNFKLTMEYKKIFSSSSIFLKFIATGCFSTLLATCYSVIQVMTPGELFTKTFDVTVRDSEHEPIPGLELSIVENNQEFGITVQTDENGKVVFSQEFSYNLANEYLFKIRDMMEHKTGDISVLNQNLYHSIRKNWKKQLLSQIYIYLPTETFR